MKLKMKLYRLKKEMTLRELSNLTGFSAGYLSLIENHKASPRLNTLKKIGQALEVCPKHLIFGCDKIVCNKYCTFYKEN